MTPSLLKLVCSLLPGQTDAEKSVAAGREALDHWGRYPWYDAEADAVRRVDVSPPSSWSDWLDFDWGFSAQSGGGLSAGAILQFAAWVAIAGLLVGLVFLLVRAYIDRAGHLPQNDDLPEDQRRPVDFLPFPLKAARSDLLDEARRSYRQADYGEAVKYLFSYQLLQLDRHQIIRLTRGKTNRQYVREMGSRRTLRRLVEQTMVAFEDFFFGNRTIDRARFESCWSQLPQFEAQLAEGIR